MEYSIAIPIFVFVLYGMIFLVQKFLEKVDPSIEEIDMSRVIPYLVPVSRDIGSDYRNKIFYIKIKMGVGRLPYFLS